MHRSLDSRSFGKPQSMFIYGKTSLEKIGSKRREKEKEPIFFFRFCFLAREGSPWADECNSHIPSLQKVSIVLHFLKTDMLSRSVTIRYSVPRWPRKQKSSTYISFSVSVWEHNSRIHLYYVKLMNFSIYFFPVPFKTFLIIWRKRGYKCQKGIFPTVCGTGHAFH